MHQKDVFGAAQVMVAMVFGNDVVQGLGDGDGALTPKIFCRLQIAKFGGECGSLRNV